MRRVALFVESDVSAAVSAARSPRGGSGESRHAPHVRHEVGGGHIYRKAIVLGEVADEFADLERRLKRVDAEDFDRAGSGREQAEEDSDEGGFAGAVCADESDDAGISARGVSESRAVTPG